MHADLLYILPNMLEFLLKENQYLLSSVVFAGFSSDALVTRIQDSKFSMLYPMQNCYYPLKQV